MLKWTLFPKTDGSKYISGRAVAKKVMKLCVLQIGRKNILLAYQLSGYINQL